MARTEIITYYCDVCGNIVENENYLSELNFVAGKSFKSIKQEDYPNTLLNPLKSVPEMCIPKIYESRSFEVCDKCMMRLYHYTMMILANENLRFRDGLGLDGSK